MYDFFNERKRFLSIKVGYIAGLFFYLFPIIDKKISQGEIM